MKIRATSRWATAIGVAAALALPPATTAQTPIPPDNSAVNQYTESYPSARGDRHTGGDWASRTPSQALGRRKARRLEAQGLAGEATATLVATTAPGSIDAAARPGAGGGSAERGGGSGSVAANGQTYGPTLPVGSSGLGEVLGQATGLSATGVLLPLAILLTAAWALAYLWRRRYPAA